MNCFLPGVGIIESNATKIFFLATDCQGVLRKADSVGSKEQTESSGGQVRSEAAFCVLLGLGLFTSPGGLDATLLGWDPRWFWPDPFWQFCPQTTAFLPGLHCGGPVLDLVIFQEKYDQFHIYAVYSLFDLENIDRTQDVRDWLKDGKARLLPSRFPGLRRKACKQEFQHRVMQTIMVSGRPRGRCSGFCLDLSPGTWPRLQKEQCGLDSLVNPKKAGGCPVFPSLSLKDSLVQPSRQPQSGPYASSPPERTLPRGPRCSRL